MMMRRVNMFALTGLSLLTGLVLWEFAARDISRVVFAPPSAVLTRLAADIASGVLPLALLGSLATLAVGFLLAVVLALPLGFAIGRNAKAAAMTDPVLNAIYAVPPVAMVPFLIIWFGLFFEARVALVFLMSFFEILVTVAAGARNVDHALRSSLMPAIAREILQRMTDGPLARATSIRCCSRSDGPSAPGARGS